MFCQGVNSYPSLLVDFHSHCDPTALFCKIFTLFAFRTHFRFPPFRGKLDKASVLHCKPILFNPFVLNIPLNLARPSVLRHALQNMFVYVSMALLYICKNKPVYNRTFTRTRSLLLFFYNSLICIDGKILIRI